MLVRERHEKIVELVNQRNSIRVSELSSIFSVTEETIRRDLEKLEKEQRLSRSHGGAISIRKEEPVDLPFSEREITNVKEKKEIALEAIKQVVQGDRLILDASTTAWYMAKALPNIPITVVTNSIKVAMELSIKKEITVICTGGTLLSESLSFVGPITDISLDTYHVNKAFISCKGLHLTRGISESNEQQALIKKKMIDISDSVYIMLDHTKFGVQSFARISDLEKINHVITDSKISDEIISTINDRGLHVIKVSPC